MGLTVAFGRGQIEDCNFAGEGGRMVNEGGHLFVPDHVGANGRHNVSHSDSKAMQRMQQASTVLTRAGAFKIGQEERLTHIPSGFAE
jgi:hypothetical protein